MGPAQPLVISTGCPRSIGPEVSLLACAKHKGSPLILVGDRGVLGAAASRLGWAKDWAFHIPEYSDSELNFSGVRIATTGPRLSVAASLWGKPKAVDGLAQLLYIERAYQICRQRGFALVTAPVSKEVIAHCGEKRATRFLGHTEWLEQMDGARYSVMCFQSQALTTSLVTTHVPVRALSRLLSPRKVCRAIVELCDLLIRAGTPRPLVAVCSLNPHAGEGELLGTEERTAILPGILQAKEIVGRRAQIVGPIGAETAFRKGAGGSYSGVVAMYHDQATIPMKLLDFGGAVNVTQGLSIVRTSVDHGTAYDIAGKGKADARGMIEALNLAKKLSASSRRLPLCD